jgi:hypothetical protein
MTLSDKVSAILTKPTTFFRKLNEKGVGDAFRYLALFYLVFLALTVLISVYTTSVLMGVMQSYFGSSMMASPSMGLRLLFALIGYPFSLLLSFVGAGILYLYLLIFGGKASYSQTYQLAVYAYTPTFLLGWIPLVSVVTGIWSFALLVIGTAEIHKMSRLKAALLYLIPGIIIAFLAALLISIIAAALIASKVVMPALTQ